MVPTKFEQPRVKKVVNNGWSQDETAPVLAGHGPVLKTTHLWLSKWIGRKVVVSRYSDTHGASPYANPMKNVIHRSQRAQQE